MNTLIRKLSEIAIVSLFATGGLVLADEGATTQASKTKSTKATGHGHKHSKKAESCEKSCGPKKDCQCDDEKAHSDHHEGEDNHKH